MKIHNTAVVHLQTGAIEQAIRRQRPVVHRHVACHRRTVRKRRRAAVHRQGVLKITRHTKCTVGCHRTNHVTRDGPVARVPRDQQCVAQHTTTVHRQIAIAVDRCHANHVAARLDRRH